MKKFMRLAAVVPALLLSLAVTGRSAERLMVQAGHVRPIWAFQFSPDGQYLLTRADESESILWNARTGDMVRVLQQSCGPWLSYEPVICELSPDGKTILLGEQDSAVDRLVLQATDTGRTMHVLELEKGPQLGTVKFSDDGRYVLSMRRGNGDGEFQLWDAATGKRVVNANRSEEKPAPPDSPAPTAQGNPTYFRFLKSARPDGKLLTFSGYAEMDNGTDGFFFPDKRHFVERAWTDTGSPEDVTTIWDLASMKEVWHGAEFFGEREIFVFAPDGKHFLRGIYTQAADLMETESCRPILAFSGHQARITRLAFSPDGRSVASGDEGGTVIVWDVDTARELARITGFDGPIRSLAYRHDAKRFLVGGGDKRPHVQCVDLSGKTLFTIPDSSQATFSPDGTRIATDTALCDGETGRLLRRTYGNSPFQIELSPSGNRALAVPKEPRFGRVVTGKGAGMPPRLWNTRTAEMVRQFDATADYYDVSGDARYPVQPPATRTSKGAGDVRPSPSAHQWVRLGRFAPAIHEVIPKIASLDAEGRQWLDGLVDRPPRPPVIAPYSGTSPGQSPSGRYFVVGRRSPQLWEAAPLLGLEIQSRDGQRVAGLDFDGWSPTAWVFNGDETRLLVAYQAKTDEGPFRLQFADPAAIGDLPGKTAERPLVLWDLAKGQRLSNVQAIRDEHPDWKITALTLSPNERYAAVTIQGAYRILLVDLKTGQTFPMKSEPGENYSTPPALFSPDSKRVYCYGYRRTLWDIETQKMLVDFGAYNGASSPIFSPGGKVIFVLDEGPGRHGGFWDAETGKLLHRFGDGAAQILKFSPDGTRLVPVGVGREPTHLWDFETGKPIVPLEPESAGPIRDALFTADGKKLITTHESGLAVWETQSGRRLSFHGEDAFPFDSLYSIQAPFFQSPSRLVTIHHGGALLWDIDAGQPIHRFPAPPARRTSAILSPDGKRLLVVSPGVQGVLWDIASGEKLQTFADMPADVVSPQGEVKFSGDGSRVFARHRAGQAVIAWDAATGRVAARFYLVNSGNNWLTVFPESGRFVGATEFVRTAP